MNSFSTLLREERPDYKVYNNGIDTLTNVDLISLIIDDKKDPTEAMNQARQIMNVCGGSLRTLLRKRGDELRVVQGITDRKALALQAAAELAKRAEQENAANRIHFDSADAVWRYFRPILGTADHEEAHVIFMSQSLEFIKSVRISLGGITETAIDVRNIVREAVLANATVMTLVHNHPGNSTRPSNEDKRITQSVKKACELMRIYLCDHVIIADSGYYSFREEGLI